MKAGAIVRLREPLAFPDLATRRGTVVPEPVETAEVVCVQWDGRATVVWLPVGAVMEDGA